MNTENTDKLKQGFAEKRELVRFYSKNYDKARDEEKVGWLERHCQKLNFIELVQIIPPGSDDFSVLDAGCGLGALKHFLAERFKNVSYSGWDINPWFVNQAKDPEIIEKDFLISDEKEKYDYVFGSGLLSFNINNEEKQYEYRSE